MAACGFPIRWRMAADCIRHQCASSRAACARARPFGRTAGPAAGRRSASGVLAAPGARLRAPSGPRRRSHHRDQRRRQRFRGGHARRAGARHGSPRCRPGSGARAAARRCAALRAEYRPVAWRWCTSRSRSTPPRSSAPITAAGRSIWPQERPVALSSIGDAALPAGADPAAVRRALEDAASQRGLPVRCWSRRSRPVGARVRRGAAPRWLRRDGSAPTSRCSAQADSDDSWAWTLDAGGAARASRARSDGRHPGGAADVIAAASDAVMQQAEVGRAGAGRRRGQPARLRRRSSRACWPRRRRARRALLEVRQRRRGVPRARAWRRRRPGGRARQFSGCVRPRMPRSRGGSRTSTSAP